MQDAIDQYHRVLLDLWAAHASSGLPGLKRAPHFGQAPQSGRQIDVLFLGLNPSYVESVMEEHWTAVHTSDESLRNRWREALDWSIVRSRAEQTRLQSALEQLDLYSRSNYARYFDAVERLATEAGAGVAWHHLDVFPIREKTQLEFVRHIPVSTKTTLSWHPLFVQLLDAAVTLMLAMRPKVVVVLNAHLSRVLVERLPLSLQANGHRYESKRLPGVLFLLGSQLSGGATSTYGRQRLASDLRDALCGGRGLRAT